MLCNIPLNYVVRIFLFTENSIDLALLLHCGRELEGGRATERKEGEEGKSERRGPLRATASGF